VLGDRVFVDVYGVARGIPIYTVDLTRLVQP
jgi:hypothetical protein